jgi:hypothetical protein
LASTTDGTRCANSGKNAANARYTNGIVVIIDTTINTK